MIAEARKQMVQMDKLPFDWDKLDWGIKRNILKYLKQPQVYAECPFDHLPESVLQAFAKQGWLEVQY